VGESIVVQKKRAHISELIHLNAPGVSHEQPHPCESFIGQRRAEDMCLINPYFETEEIANNHDICSTFFDNSWRTLTGEDQICAGNSTQPSCIGLDHVFVFSVIFGGGSEEGRIHSICELWCLFGRAKIVKEAAV
jgi:hypothetical protein